MTLHKLNTRATPLRREGRRADRNQVDASTEKNLAASGIRSCCSLFVALYPLDAILNRYPVFFFFFVYPSCQWQTIIDSCTKALLYNNIL